MKAFVYDKFGPPDVLMLREVEKPIPGDKEVLIKVHATTVNAADCNARGFSYIPKGLGFLARLMLGIRKPKINILGSSGAGVIEAVGKDVGKGGRVSWASSWVCKSAWPSLERSNGPGSTEGTLAATTTTTTTTTTSTATTAATSTIVVCFREME